MHGVPIDLTPEEVVESLGSRDGLTFQEREVRYLFGIKGRATGQCGMVFAIAPHLFPLLMRMGKVSIGWTMAQIRKFTPVVRCYKCLEHGHFQRACLQSLRRVTPDGQVFGARGLVRALQAFP